MFEGCMFESRRRPDSNTKPVLAAGVERRQLADERARACRWLGVAELQPRQLAEEADADADRLHADGGEHLAWTLPVHDVDGKDGMDRRASRPGRWSVLVATAGGAAIARA
jgi:hypothetical protein